MDWTPPVTLIMCVRNGMPHLRPALQAIADQTYRNFRLLVWDNGSTDDTVAELQRWIPQRIPGAFEANRPMSIGASRQALLEWADTDLCAICDADDVSLPERIAEQAAYMAAHPEVGLLGTYWKHIDEHDQITDSPHRYPTRDADIRWRLRFGNSMVQPTVMFRRDLVLSVGGYTGRQIGEDCDLWLRLCTRTRITILDQPLLLCRHHTQNVTKTTAFDPIQLYRELVSNHVGDLFPGVDPGSSLRVRRVLIGDSDAAVHWSDNAVLWQMARQAARAAGEPAGYFAATELFKHQQARIAHRLLNRVPGVTRARQWKRAAAETRLPQRLGAVRST